MLSRRVAARRSSRPQHGLSGAKLIAAPILVLALAGSVFAGAQGQFAGSNEASRPNSPLKKAASRSAQPSKNAAPRPDARQFGKLPMAFVPNMGQTHPSVRFVGHAMGLPTFFTSDQVSLPVSTAAQCPSEGKGLEAEDRAGGVREPSPRLSVKFLGANPTPNITAQKPLPGRFNFLKGKDDSQSRTNVTSYERLTYEGLYPGVNLQYAGATERLKGTYTLRAGTDPSRIRWQYEGAQQVDIDKRGNLVIGLQGCGKQGAGATARKLVEKAPIAWQTDRGVRTPVPIKFTLGTDGSAGFELGRYDPKRTLIIDPELGFSTFLGGSGARTQTAEPTAGDWGKDIAVDGEGNSYIAGVTDSQDFPTTDSAYITNGNFLGNGGFSSYVTKLNAAGSAVIYSTFASTSNQGEAVAIAVDAEGSAYIAGNTEVASFQPIATMTIGSAIAPSAPFALKLNPSGTATEYAVLIAEGDHIGGIAVDGAKNLYVTGAIDCSDAGPWVTFRFRGQSTCNATHDTFVIKLNAAGNELEYGALVGGTSADHPTTFGARPYRRAFDNLAVSSNGTVFVSGFTASRDFPTTGGAFQEKPVDAPLCNAGGQPCTNAFVTALAPSGRGVLYSTYLGGGGRDYAWAIAVGNDGGAWVAGVTSQQEPSQNPTQPGWVPWVPFPTKNAYQPQHGGGDYGNPDGFLAKLTPDGKSLVYSTHLGGPWNDAALDVEVADSGEVYVVGDAEGEMPVKNPIHEWRSRSIGGELSGPTGMGEEGILLNGGDGFVAKFSSDGSELFYLTPLGGALGDIVEGLAVDRLGRAYVTGYTSSPDFPTTPGAFQRTFPPKTLKDSGAAFVARICDEPCPILTLSVSDATVPEGDSGTVPAAFVVELSLAAKEVVNVPYTVSAGTAVASEDYLPVPGAVVFLPGETRKELAVPVVGDTVQESQENFHVDLAPLSEVVAVKARGIGNIIDNDIPVAGGGTNPPKGLNEETEQVDRGGTDSQDKSGVTPTGTGQPPVQPQAPVQPQNLATGQPAVNAQAQTGPAAQAQPQAQIQASVASQTAPQTEVHLQPAAQIQGALMAEREREIQVQAEYLAAAREAAAPAPFGSQAGGFTGTAAASLIIPIGAVAFGLMSLFRPLRRTVFAEARPQGRSRKPGRLKRGHRTH